MRTAIALALLLSLVGCTLRGDGVPAPAWKRTEPARAAPLFAAAPPRLEIRARYGLSGLAVVRAEVATAAEWSAELQAVGLPGELRLTLLAPGGVVAGNGAVKVQARWTSRLPPGHHRADVYLRTADGSEALRIPVVVAAEE